MEFSLESIWPGWEIERKLGEGSDGQVYQAVHRELGIELRAAVKVVSVHLYPGDLAALRAEGVSEEEALAELSQKRDAIQREISYMQTLKGEHNIVGIEDFRAVDAEEGNGWTIYIRMELLPETLNEWLDGRSVTEQDVVKLGTDLCSALEACERKEILHRDIKPENIFVDSKGSFKLGDFGISRHLEGFKRRYTQMQGTQDYIAPEAVNESVFDHRSDIYSLGIVLYRLMNRNRGPFLDTEKRSLGPDVRKAADNLRLSGKKPLPPPRDASPELARVILKACAFLPEDRYASAAELRSALERCAAGPEDKPAPPRSPVPLWAKLGAVLLLCLAVGTVLWLSVRGRSAAEPGSETASAPTAAPTAAQETALPTDTPTPTAPPTSAPAPFSAALMADSFQGFTGKLETDIPAAQEAAVFRSGYRRKDIRSITFRASLEGRPDDAWDVSARDGRGEVWAWVTDASYPSGAPGLYDLTIAAEGGVKAPADLSSCFVGYTNLKYVDWNGAVDLSGTTSLRAMFYGCSSLTEPNLQALDTSRVTDMSVLFYGCTGLKALDLRGLDTSSVTRMSWMFFSCTGLETLDLRGLDTSKVTDMEYMFYGCTGLETLDLRGLDTSSVTDMRYMFSNCSGLRRFEGAFALDTAKVEAMAFMFSECSRLQELIFDPSHVNTSAVRSFEGMFRGCSSLTALDLSCFDTTAAVGCSVDGTSYEAFSFMFAGSTGLQTVTLDPARFQTARADSMYCMFYQCSGLTAVDVSGFDLSAVKNTGYMFSDCTALEGLTFHTSLPVGEYMFANCTGLKEIRVRGGLLGEPAPTAFRNCAPGLYYPAYEESWSACAPLCSEGGLRLLPMGSGDSAIAAGADHSVGLKADGTVVAVGRNENGQCDFYDGWKDIVSVAAGGNHTVGLKADGTVVAVGDDRAGQCRVRSGEWTDIVAIAAGQDHTVGLKADGTVVAVGKNECGECDVQSWTDIIAIAAARQATVGLRLDGTVCYAGSFLKSDAEDTLIERINRIAALELRASDPGLDAVSIACGEFVIVVRDSMGQVRLLADGNDWITNDRSKPECCLNWTDIVSLSAYKNLIVGLRTDGTVVVDGETEPLGISTEGWEQVVAVSSGSGFILGLTADGRVLATGSDRYGQCGVSAWRDIAAAPRME